MIHISAIIATYNRPQDIKRTLRSLTNQSYPSENYEIIVIDDGSEASAVQDLAEFIESIKSKCMIKLIALSRNGGKAKAINAGIRALAGSITLITDDDCEPSRDWIESHVKSHGLHPEQCSVIGSIFMPSAWCASSNICRYINSRYANKRLSGAQLAGKQALPPKFFAGGNVSTPTRTLIDIGLFDESIGRAQDVELGFRLWKANIPLFFCENAAVIHHAKAALDLDRWLQVLAKAYKDTAPQLKSRHPEAYAEFGHWFLEKPNWTKEAPGMSLKKAFVRSMLSESLNQALKSILKRNDSNPKYYWPMAYHYVFAATCLSAVKSREVISKL